MKKIFTLFLSFISLVLFAQVPNGIPYQAIALNSNGTAVANANVGIKISILDSSTSGSLVFAETHTKTTNAQGLFNLNIGQGTTIAGNFATINWAVNSKFLKVEMDVAGGSNYVLVGTTQLLSVPYAIAAKKLVAPAGEGVTLVAPNGTPYELTVNNSGQLSLPTSGTPNQTIPNTLFLYGSFNGNNVNNAIPMTNSFGDKYVYKYFTAGTTLRFSSQNNSSGVLYGVTNNDIFTVNGDPITLVSNGIYCVKAYTYQEMNGVTFNIATAENFSPKIHLMFSDNGYFENPINLTSYNVATNTVTYILNGLTNTNNSYTGFKFALHPIGQTFNSQQHIYFGDNLSDGTTDYNGSIILFPNLNSTPKNYKIDLVLNTAGANSTYTITQIP